MESFVEKTTNFGTHFDGTFTGRKRLSGGFFVLANGDVTHFFACGDVDVSMPIFFRLRWSYFFVVVSMPIDAIIFRFRKDDVSASEK